MLDFGYPLTGSHTYEHYVICKQYPVHDLALCSLHAFGLIAGLMMHPER